MKLAVACLLATGCSVGIGSSYVGQWRPRTERSFIACLENERGECVEQKLVEREVPGRRFWGWMINFPAIGASFARRGDGPTETRFRLEAGTEVIRGVGRFAWGVRGSAIIDNELQTSFGVMGLGYYSLTDRVAVRAGAGYQPFSRTWDEGSEDAFVGVRGLVGAQYVLSRTHSENFMILSVDVDRMYVAFDDPVHATGVVFNLGIFF